MGRVDALPQPDVNSDLQGGKGTFLWRESGDGESSPSYPDSPTLRIVIEHTQSMKNDYGESDSNIHYKSCK